MSRNFALYEPTPEHQQELFVDAHRRWPKRPYCSDDLESGLRIRSLMQALKKPYIQANPPYLRVWSIYDVDRPYCDYEKGEFHRSAVLAWEDANLPLLVGLPSIQKTAMPIWSMASVLRC